MSGEAWSHEALRARLARPDYARLPAVTAALEGVAGVDEAVERLEARGLVPLGALSAHPRRFVHASGRGRARPETLEALAYVAAAYETLEQAERLASEAHAALEGLGFGPLDEPRWRVCEGLRERDASIDGEREPVPSAALLIATQGLDELGACGFDAGDLARAGTLAGLPRAGAAASLEAAAVSVWFVSTAWKLLRPGAPRSPAEPIVELFALGALLFVDPEGLELGLPAPLYPALACAQCGRVERYEPARFVGRLASRCARCLALRCDRCDDPLAPAPCARCGGSAATVRLGPA